MRHHACRPQAPIAPPPHPNFDLDAAVKLALEEDAGELGDVTTLSTCACMAHDDGAEMRAPA